MADDITFTPGAGGTVRARDLGNGKLVQAVSQIPITPADANDGFSTHSRLSVGVTEDQTVVKASAGNLYGGYITNANAAARFFKLYDKATAPAPASDTPKLRIRVEGGGGVDLFAAFGGPIYFANGIAYVLVTGVADTDVAEVAANDIIVNLTYK